MLKLKLFPLSKRTMKMFVTTLLKLKPLLNKAGKMNTPPPLTLKVMNFSPVSSLKNSKISPTNAKLNIFQIPWNLQSLFILLLIWLTLKTSHLKKLKLKNFLLKLIFFQTPSIQIQMFKILLRNLHKSKSWILIINLNRKLKNIVPFATKIITMFPLAFVDSICLKNLNHNLALQLLPFINILQPPLKNLNILAHRSRSFSNPYRRSSRDAI